MYLFFHAPPKDNGEVIVGLIAALIALTAVVISIYTLNETRRIAKYQMNTMAITETERAFLKSSQLLLLHGVSPMDLTTDEISIEEFSYILSSLRASEAYYVINRGETNLSYYRENFLNNPKVKLVYDKYLRSKFSSNESFIILVDKYYSNLS